jgi:uncharacterized membrane protein HdeD (DUF308 family)
MSADAIPIQQQQPSPWWILLLQGLAALLLGILLLSAPAATIVFLIQFLGWYWLINGIFNIVGIFLDHSLWGWKLVAGGLGVLAGLAVLNHPLWSAVLLPTTLIWVVGIFGIIIGASMLIQAFQGAGWGTGILGILSIILGLLLIVHPFASALAVPWIFGVFAIAGGLASIAMAFTSRST